MNHFKLLVLAASVATITACGGGGGGSSSSSTPAAPSAPTTPVDSNPPTQVDTDPSAPSTGASKSTVPVFDLSDVQGLINYGEAVDRSGVAQKASAVAVTSPVHSSKLIFDEEFLSTMRGDANIVGLDAEGNRVYPIENITPLDVQYFVESPDGQKVYFKLGQNSYQFFENFYLDLNFSNDDGDDFYVYLPIIAPPISIDIPFTQEQLEAHYGEGASAYSLYDENNEVFIVYQDSNGDELARVSYEEVKSSILTNLGTPLLCNIVEIDRETNNYSCLGETQTKTTELSISAPGFYVSMEMEVEVANFIAGDPYYWHEDVRTAYENIRPGLKPIQFDTEGNRYLLGRPSLEESTNAQLLKIDDLGAVSNAFDVNIDSQQIDSFVVLADGNIAFRYINTASNYYERILAMYMSDTGARIDLPENYWSETYQVDEHNTIVADGFLFQPNAQNGINQLPLTFRGIPVNNRVVIERDGSVYTCLYTYENSESRERLYRVLPYHAEPLSESCYFNNWSSYQKTLVDSGYFIFSEDIQAGNFGNTSVIRLQSLSDGTEFGVFQYDTFDANTPRYTIHEVSAFDGQLYFSGVRNTAPIGAVIGQVDLEKLVTGAPEEEYLSISDEDSSIASNAQVREITFLPSAEGTASGVAPKVDRVLSDPENLSFVNIEFSEYMNRESVINSLSLTHEEQPELDFISFWGGRNLYLFGDSDGLEGVNEGERSFLSSEMPYRLDIDVFTAFDESGTAMSQSTDPNAEHEFTLTGSESL
ncbi:hypothetical protein [Marinibactrum halimedae]|uniref:Uncharacterized protein n=1 Tax=Marinibactrum halimedae TaxID=1444977 RepID=A0AA37T971_9GAMM|nr:hypothetical protein [Marinibactrum halimedae]MCD9459329.1 hypothetical protein [Marinibactrum halimedae]GLS25780.1 hypothetical protein GCM10007877_14940 [Marinibactrum halimedae]